MNGTIKSDPQASRNPATIGDTAVAVAVGAFLIYFVLQVENVLRQVVGDEAIVSTLGRLALAQFENLAVALLAVTPLPWISGHRTLRRVYGAMIAVFLVYLVADQVFYALFFDHFQFGLMEGQEISAAIFKDSILFELGWAFYANLVLAVMVSALLVWRLDRPHVELWTPSWLEGNSPARLTAGCALVAYGGLSFAYSHHAALNNLNHHPVVSIVKSLVAPALRQVDDAEIPSDLESLRYGSSTPNRDELSAQAALDRWSLLRRGGRPPNIVLIVLESVGALQLLPRGALDPTLTPRLAKLGPELTIYPSVYGFFPGTVRAHVPLATGGRSITWGSVYKEYSRPYRGPTIAGELKRAGYSTALYSAAYMETENLGGFYATQPFDVRFFPDEAETTFKERNAINSWGVDERKVAAMGMAWATGEKARGRPFFLQLLTSSTHHPYSVPQDFTGPFGSESPDGNGRLDRYRNALNFLDRVIGQVVDDLEASGTRGDTLLFITGDHGQAFADLHPTNLTHKNHIYEENIRNVLLVIDPGEAMGPRVVTRVASIGDIAPTITNLAGLPPSDFAGQSLFAASYRERLVFFHKNAQPEKWGLRDGRWKFIVEKVGGKRPELYDLAVDPTEQKNLAAAHEKQVAEYRSLCAGWFLATNAAFVARLDGDSDKGDLRLSSDDIQSFGPKRLRFGTQVDDASGGRHFVELSLIHPDEDMVVWSFGVPFPTDQEVVYEWLPPPGAGGAPRRMSFTHNHEWSTVEVRHGSPAPMAAGRWQVRLLIGGTELVRGAFLVSDSAPLHRRRP